MGCGELWFERLPVAERSLLSSMVATAMDSPPLLEVVHSATLWSGVLVITTAVGPSTWTAQTCETQQTVLLCLEENLQEGDRLTTITFELHEHTNLRVLKAQAQSKWWKHSCWHPLHCTRVKEACSGLGCLGFGLNRVGVQTTARNELQPKTVQVLNKQGGVPTVPGDISCTDVIAALHAVDPRPAGLAAGFSCQPFSKLGDMKGVHDSRSRSLVGVLRAAFLLGSAFVLLECVEPASKDSYVRSSLDSFLKATGFKAIETVLDLQDVWCAKRKRWWCLMCPPHVPLASVPCWPSMPDCQKVGEVIHVDGASQEEEEALTLSDEELREFQLRKPIKGYLLNLEQALPTALHAWGSQTQACPCDCRRFPFTKSRLDRGGICAVLLPAAPDKESGAPNFRHMTAREVAVCNGLTPNVFMGNSPRLALALVGQMASPFQSAWMMSHFAEALVKLEPLGLSHEAPLSLLRNQRAELLAVAEGAGLRHRATTSGVALQGNEVSKKRRQSPEVSSHPKVAPQADMDVATTATDSTSEADCLADESTTWWREWEVPKRGFMSHLLQEAPFELGAVVQVCDEQGVLLPPDAILRQHERVKVWVAGPPQTGVGVLAQSTSLPPDVDSFLKPTMLRHARVKALEQQGIWLTDDQMRFGLDAIAGATERPIQVVDPLIMHRCLTSQNPKEFCKLTCRLQPGDEIITAFLHQGHWVAMHWKVEVGRVHAWTSTPSGVGIAEVSVADWLLSHAAGRRNFSFYGGLDRPMSPGLCGHFALADLSSQVCGIGPLPLDMALQHTAYIAAAFQACLPGLCRAPVLIGGVQPSLLEQSLAKLLREKGAVEGDVSARASSIISRLGIEAVQRALQAQAPWRQLKAIAGVATPPI